MRNQLLFVVIPFAVMLPSGSVNASTLLGHLDSQWTGLAWYESDPAPSSVDIFLNVDYTGGGRGVGIATIATTQFPFSGTITFDSNDVRFASFTGLLTNGQNDEFYVTVEPHFLWPHGYSLYTSQPHESDYGVSPDFVGSNISRIDVVVSSLNWWDSPQSVKMSFSAEVFGVPEPSALVMLAVGVISFLAFAFGWRRRQTEGIKEGIKGSMPTNILSLAPNP
jgi:hypothetical protein